MLTYKNDFLLFDKANKPKNYITIKTLIKNSKDLIFIRKDILNLYPALVKKKDFKRNTDKLNMFLRRTPYLSGKDITIGFLKTLNKIYPKRGGYIKFREEIADYCGLKTRIPLAQFNNWIKREEIPIVAVRVLASKFNNELRIMSNLFSKCIKISGVSTRGFLPPLTLKKGLSDLNLYFIGSAFGDGGFENECCWTLVDGTSEKNKLFYSERYIKFIGGILKKVYKIKVFNISKSKNKVVLTISNKFFCRFINFFYDIPFGYKGEKLLKPKIFEYGKNEYLFWRGLCDTDGSFRSSTKTFTIGMKQKRLLIEFAGFLRKKNISYSIRGQHLNVLIDSLSKFAKVVGSSHPRKQKILLKQLREGPSHRVLIDLNRDNLKNSYFDLSKIPNLRVYITNLFKKIFKDLDITQIMEKTGVSRQTVHNWKNNFTAMPFTLIKDFYKGDILEVLSQNNCMFTFGKKGSNKAHLPIKVTKKIKFFASCVKPTKRGLHLNIRKNPEVINHKKQIEDFFKIKFNYVHSKEYRCESAIVNIFFKTFFIYDLPWKSYNEHAIEELKKDWIINKIDSVKDREQKTSGKYYYT